MNKAYSYYRVSELCSVLGVSPSTYYYKPAPVSLNEERLRLDAKLEFAESNQTYGKRRLSKALCNKGYRVGVDKARRLMKELGLIAITPKKKHHYPDAGNECQYAPNHLGL